MKVEFSDSDVTNYFNIHAFHRLTKLINLQLSYTLGSALDGLLRFLFAKLIILTKL